MPALRCGTASNWRATRHEPLQVWSHRQYRCAHRSRRDGRGKFLRQDHTAGAQSGTHDRHIHAQPQNRRQIMDWEVSAAGYAAVWAHENTRASLWDAMQRKETYATTGSRMIVRFFGGWDFEKADAETRSPAVAGYTKGVPMGGDLQPHRRARRRAFSSPPCAIRSARTSTAFKSSRGGWTRKATCTKRSMTWSGAATARPMRPANSRVWGVPWTSRTRRGRTPSARRS